MKKLAIIDLDGVVANSHARFALAKRDDGSIDWKIAFNHANVHLDTLLDGADQAIKNLQKQGYRILFLTSRPESMRIATHEWLTRHDIDYHELVMKPPHQQYVKTVTWKTQMIENIAALEHGEILFIDDEIENRNAVEFFLMNIVCKPSLDDYKPGDAPSIL